MVAPSGPFDRAAALQGIAWLEERYRVSYRKTLFARAGYLAGTDARRLDELQSALDADVRAVIAVRGGYGLSRIVHRVDWSAARQRPRWIVGFSDITALHAEAWRRGLASVHGSMVCSLGQVGEKERQQWLSTLEEPMGERCFRNLVPWRGGQANGTLVGGNLAMLHACAAARRFRIPKGAVVLIEDIAERPYRVDRMLTNLMTGGHLANASAILVGNFTDCPRGPDTTSVDVVLKERLAHLRIPVVAGMPVGHGDRNDAVILGRRVAIDAKRGLCTFVR